MDLNVQPFDRINPEYWFYPIEQHLDVDLNVQPFDRINPEYGFYPI